MHTIRWVTDGWGRRWYCIHDEDGVCVLAAQVRTGRGRHRKQKS